MTMNAFELVDGRQTITGNPVRIDVVEVARDGAPRVKTVLSNGSSVRVVHSGNRLLSMFTGKGAVRVTVGSRTAVKFYVDGVEVATVDGDNVHEFDVVAPVVVVPPTTVDAPFSA